MAGARPHYLLVEKGDTLSEIAWRYNDMYHYGNDVVSAYKKLAEMNYIKNPNKIVVGQVLQLNPEYIIKQEKYIASQVYLDVFGLQSDTDRTVYAAWEWDREHTDGYKCMWYYSTGDGLWFVGSDSTEKNKQSVYTAPNNAKKVKFKVKPISKKHKVKRKEVYYWTGKWSSYKEYSFANNPPAKLSAPSVSVDEKNKNKLIIEVDNIDKDWTGDKVEFQVVIDDKKTFATGTSKIVTWRASYTCTMTPGHTYKVRCRGINVLKKGKEYGEWSDYSSDVKSVPNAPKGFKTIKALTHTSVSVDWYDNETKCTGYELQYTTQERYFDSNPNEVKSQTVESVVGHAEVSGLETGYQYFFRVRAVNSAGNSAWSPTKSIKLGVKPSPPTTWSTTTTVIVGEKLSLYWVHNSEDGSSQTYAQLELTVNGNTTTQTIKNSTNEDEKDLTSVYEIDTTSYSEGAQIKWRVRTKGVIDTYSDWSVQRTIDIYSKPKLILSVEDLSGNEFVTLTSFPFKITGVAEPKTQSAIGYHITIVANESYETVDQVGETKMVRKGDAVYSKYFDIDASLNVSLSAGDIDLENNIEYTVQGVVSMNSGLRASASLTFNVAWVEKEYEPNTEIGYDDSTYTVALRPYCVDADNNMVSDVTLSVYRRQHDGEFVEIASGLNNSSNTYVVDPHPSLDYARYRVVAIENSTGGVSYYDVPGYPIDEPAVIIQWDEEWSVFDASLIDENDVPEDPPWAGSLLRIPYNIDVSDKTNPDVSLVKYIGRKRPVSYYGTQLGETSSWKMEIPKDDKDTLYTIRRLAIWMGDVYVREPSGSGYWANINVSFSQTHNNLTIPVTLDITRVEGGA